MGKRKIVSEKIADPGALWQHRFERLAQFMDDAKFDIKNKGFDRSENRAWEPSEFVYVSFCLTTTQNEDNAIKTFGKGKYDTYQLVKLGDEE